MNEPGELRPLTLLVSAIGGEGGGVLASWIVEAARHHGLAVQSTSIPGVAQRTGATTYYIEIFPTPIAELDGKRPVFALYPGIGDVDVMVASEFLEAGRAIAGGFLTPDRTALIASTHRVYAIAERIDMADGRFDTERLFEAAAQRTRQAFLGDLNGAARKNGVSLNAILLGVLAASRLLPIPQAAFEAAVAASGIAVDANLRGFNAGLVYPFAETPARPAPDAAAKRPRGPTVVGLERQVSENFPAEVQGMVREGVRRLVHYQNPDYAALYLQRLATVLDAERGGGGDMSLTRETASHLAVRMSYEDVIRVAQLKTDPARYGRGVEEVRAKDGEPVAVVEYFKPGIDELCAIMPPRLAEWLLETAERRGWRSRLNLALRIKTTTVWGFLRIRLLATLRPFRPKTYGYREEQRAIEQWLGLVLQAAGRDLGLAFEVAECARLIKGYGDTHRRGTDNFDRIVTQVIRPALAGAMTPAAAADAIANARIAALADPGGERLTAVLSAIEAAGISRAAE